MTITLTGGAAVDQDALKALEAALGRRLSQPFREFVLSHDGAEPENNAFDVGRENNQSSVRRFIPVKDIFEERAALGGIPPEAYPVAYDGFGNYILIDEARAGEVLFWDHETHELTKIAPDFGAFISLLQPFDINSVPLDSTKVISVWVHPDLARYQKH